jgi:crotonobetaine/carnitine-CoA ligase
MLPNSAKAFLIWQGLSWLRAIETPIHHLYRRQNLVHVLRTSRALVALIAAEYLGRIAEVADQVPDLRELVVLDPGCAEVPASGPEAVGLTVTCEAPFLGRAPSEPEELENPRPYDIAAVLFTSGTTGPREAQVAPMDGGKQPDDGIKGV